MTLEPSRLEHPHVAKDRANNLGTEPSPLSIGYGTEIVTGVRPTGHLTVANYLGAIKPFLALQQQGFQSLIFIADMHALTDREPDQVKMNIIGVVADYLALGIDPEKTGIFLQSNLAKEVALLTTILMRHVSIAELLRLPTLKDKIRSSDAPETANALLVTYPVMMAADILLQRARLVPVGEDQIPHLEMTRKLAREFNKTYAQIFPIPEPQEVETVRILGVRGHGKMSKSQPEEAIFLSDDREQVSAKLQRACTAIEGVITPGLKSNILIAKGLALHADQTAEVDRIITEHLAGEKVMGPFKKELTAITTQFLSEFQERRRVILSQSERIHEILQIGAQTALANARTTIEAVRKVMFLD